MAFYEKLQLDNQREQSKYPFDSASTLLLDIYTFPSRWITSLNLQVAQCIFPLHVSRITVVRDTVTLSVTDAAGQLTHSIIMTESKNKILDPYNCAAGQLQTDPRLYPWLKGLVKGTVYGTLQLPYNSLIICSQAITCQSFIGYTGLSLNGTYIGQDVILNLQRNIQTKIDGTSLQLNVYGDYPGQHQQTSKLWKVNGQDLKGKTLIIKHKALADFRVSTTSSEITLTGVTDVS